MIPVFNTGDVVVISPDSAVADVYEVAFAEGKVVRIEGSEVLLELNEPALGFPTGDPENNGLWCYLSDVSLKKEDAK